MEKEFEHRDQLKHIEDEAKRKEEEKKWEEAQKKHKSHPKVHHPGSRDQLEEVWEEQDHMSAGDFKPKTFFALHDLDGNGVWDTDEVKALFVKELDKVYDPNAPEDDMRERYEEMERMREHVFNETDSDRNQLISFEEFLAQTRKNEYERDPGWDTIDQQPVFDERDYLEYERRRQAEIQHLIEQGLLRPEDAAAYQAQMPPIQGQPQMVPYQGQQPVQFQQQQAYQVHPGQPVYQQQQQQYQQPQQYQQVPVQQAQQAQQYQQVPIQQAQQAQQHQQMPVQQAQQPPSQQVVPPQQAQQGQPQGPGQQQPPPPAAYNQIPQYQQQQQPAAAAASNQEKPKPR
uniref:EOG090X0B17 n=1 Tax=Lynceus sp. MCZ IZ 141354 TaxID=1930659 RepID=A0A9N6WUA9_9CRUS|nr:EOG090X0B17 [Lynceus sp. MCZ IZ 141354]